MSKAKYYRRLRQYTVDAYFSKGKIFKFVDGVHESPDGQSIYTMNNSPTNVFWEEATEDEYNAQEIDVFLGTQYFKRVHLSTKKFKKGQVYKFINGESDETSPHTYSLRNITYSVLHKYWVRVDPREYSGDTVPHEDLKQPTNETQPPTEEKEMRIDVKTNVTLVMGQDSDKLTLSSLVTNLQTQIEHDKSLRELGLGLAEESEETQVLRKLIKERLEKGEKL